ncbi:putative DNA-binding protein containing a Zn-ribbon domain [Methanomethylovorans hollandica DSM 15978]|uniref:tRNA(Ile2) 2-agmatinylcytidine synthetase TiaS n=1 Tax=Methanomethylovorans hollandica (strain DSM 15978 / NBRC 107637 / DMS1) TaxID=867904 RepID=L0KZE3_METHD|nr:tRNA(Ile)(2)-agmatinylcytidine synthase [Methanomethylovorans hollandica]AGB50481.1 putative DNA-binding protein containing a Zn-ribbon domain [Methanomethylovorans hollandica DSM 15978]
MIIGIDDTDSREGMCTTYLGALLMEELQHYGSMQELPILVRLNPTIPYKTRGNACVGINIATSCPDKVMEHVISRVSEMSAMECEMTNPGVVFVQDDEANRVKDTLGTFFLRAVRTVLSIEEAKSIIAETGLQARGFKNGRGLIGALAACGAMLNPGWDHTFEYLAYRQRGKWGTPRNVDKDSFFVADDATYPATWDTVDVSNGLVVCVPHSPDPVLYGIRGRDPDVVKRTAGMIISEPLERSCIYCTNQGTDMHLIPIDSISGIKEMQSYIVSGSVSCDPFTIPGGHTIFSISDNSGSSVECAAFEPTKDFRSLVRKLIQGDAIKVYGSFMNKSLNIEKIEIVSLAPLVFTHNPECASCGKRMESAGRGQGYRCRKCGTRSSSLVQIQQKRDIEPGMYEVPPCARRHLAKPLVRMQTPQSKIFPFR